MTDAAPASDQDLLSAARGGDAGALDALLARHQAQVYRFGLKMCRDPEDAEDVVQDTLITLARGIRDFRGESSLSTWLYSVARSHCVKKRRKSKFAPTSEASFEQDVVAEGLDVHDPARPPDEEAAGREVQAALDRAIRSLEPMYREVLVLRDVEGLSAAEVAEVLGVTVATVKSRLHRARLAVRAAVAPLLGVVPTPAPASAPACPDVLGLLSRHLEGDISASVCAEMEEHVASCPRCRGACDSLRKTLTLCRATPAAPVPDAVQRSVRAAVRDLLDAP
ncbi:MAG: sigma-70 family RNA polymerase sigma factor [Myxococcales bacterium]|nr:sigma-70 family RNA polymerase sigma factor [Myxococcales bacterium]MCB9734879.1 sigma-70 family RNA polymerase sigma factor [Deltaproteobacteria bacterium]